MFEEGTPTLVFRVTGQPPLGDLRLKSRVLSLRRTPPCGHGCRIGIPFHRYVPKISVPVVEVYSPGQFTSRAGSCSAFTQKLCVRHSRHSAASSVRPLRGKVALLLFIIWTAGKKLNAASEFRCCEGPSMRCGTSTSGAKIFGFRRKLLQPRSRSTTLIG